MREIGKLFNAKDDTFYGLTGMGDLISPVGIKLD